MRVLGGKLRAVTRRHPAAAGAAGALLVTALGGGIAYSAVSSAGGVIQGCRNPNSGQLRVVDAGAGQSCLPSETQLTWNQTGPQGPEGRQGPAGPAGPGATYRIVEDTVWADPGFSHFEVSCPAGEYAISGSFVPLPGIQGEPPGLLQILGTGNLDGVQWRWTLWGGSARNTRVRLQIVCVPASAVTGP